MQTYRFGDFELDLDALQLRQQGEVVRLERRPLDLLVLLVTRHGRLVPREEIIAALWPARVIIDFDSGLNTLVRKVRSALDDSSDQPRFIETVPGRGYRFIAPIVAATEPAPERPDERRRTFRTRPVLAALSVSLLLASSVAVMVWQAGDMKTTDGLREPPSTGPGAGRVLRVAPDAARTLAVLPLGNSTDDEAGALLAESVTDLIRNRLATLGGLTVVAGSSMDGLIEPEADVRSVGERLQARYVLKGEAQRIGERARVDAELVDAQSGRQIWAAAFERPLCEIAAIREDIARQVGGALDIPVEDAASSRFASVEISLDAYRAYLHGQRLLASGTATDAEQAVELFKRATILDPGLARAYLGLGQALLLREVKTRPYSRSAAVLELDVSNVPLLRAQAQRALDRAVELNPTLGEAWVEHARLTQDPVEAEALYRKGLALAPNYGAGYVLYADFLFREGRAGEAIEIISRARQIDPLTPELHLLHAFFLMVVRSDVAGHDRLVREALEIDPRLPSALWQLANSRWEYSGEFADAAKLAERAIETDPQWLPARILARNVYLELDDPVAATAVLGDDPPQILALETTQYAGDRRRAAALLEDMRPEDWGDTGARASMTEAIRDGAITSGDFEAALRRLEALFAHWEPDPPMWHRASSLVYAHTLILAGEVERGRRLAEATLSLVETHGVGRAENSFSRERAAAFAVLGETTRALDELAISVRQRSLRRWWYLAEHDPLYEHLRRDPRFPAINDEAQQHLQRQRALLEELRRMEEIPDRSS